MNRPVKALPIGLVALGLAICCLPATGCLHSLLATGIYVFQGGNVVDADCDAGRGTGRRALPTACLARLPSRCAARSIGKRVSSLLEINVDNIEMVDPREVDNWIDEQDWENFKDLGRSMKASRVVYIELDRFELFKGKTLYQGDAEVKVSVYDMSERGKLMWEKPMGQLLFPRNSGIPAADKPLQHFQQQFVEIVSTQIAEQFYKHDPNSMFALDSVANQ